ncbi:hypothetical protein HMPREF9372_3684 [Sporosarcina newyorkensis 2681]|uniref:Uncharacterized protein n=1 Tax=Sporosarcina newyorkensis 2681 TaxID=1027292 RepID=F9DY03_9BACL|nr:hypothetical protein HMPREF9372_3684 [Sporosarcina newyorkensis 2681]
MIFSVISSPHSNIHLIVFSIFNRLKTVNKNVQMVVLMYVFSVKMKSE